MHLENSDMLVKEWWVVEAVQTCHDAMWFNAERGDIRSMEKQDAEKLIAKNPGKFKHVDTLKYRDGEWSDMRGAKDGV